MWLLKKRKEVRGDELSIHERMITSFAIVSRKMQEKLAIFLARRTERLPKGGLKVLLLLFCFTWGGVSLYFIAHAFTTFNKKGSHVFIERITVPKYYQRTGEERLVTKPFTMKRSLRIQSFRDYMDSLNTTEKGKKVHDSILMARPHLIDSIQALETYLSKKK